MSIIKNLIDMYHEPFMKLFSSTDGLPLEEAVKKINEGTVHYIKKNGSSTFNIGSLFLGVGITIAGIMHMFNDQILGIGFSLIVAGVFLVVHALSSIGSTAKFAYLCRMYSMQRVLNNNLINSLRSEAPDAKAFNESMVNNTYIIISKMAKVQEKQ